MLSPLGEKAISDAIENKNAVLKFISENDANATGAHQTGFYLSKPVGEMLSGKPPIKGENFKHDVNILWPDGRTTNSVITWYGKAKSEFRLTKFQKDFPWLTTESVGNLLVLIPKSLTEIVGHVLDREEDIEELLAALGVEPFEHWALYQHGAPVVFRDENECLRSQFLNFTKVLTDFPTGRQFTDATIQMLNHCIQNFQSMTLDEILIKSYSTEYELFQTVERQLCQPEVIRLFKDIDDFLNTANTIMNRRKSRAGRSLENHVDYVLQKAQIPHEVQPRQIDGKPDIVIPNTAAYFDAKYPKDKMFIVGVKTTCKDRWRQVIREGKDVAKKHIITVQPGISGNQLIEMHEAGVTLVVPRKLHKEYPKNTPMEILDLEQFSQIVKNTLPT